MDKLIKSLLVIATFAVQTSGMASAHARLTTSEPADGVVLNKSPQSVVLTFSEGLEPAFFQLSIEDAQGAKVDLKDEKVGGQDGKCLSAAPTTPLSAGSYKIDWHVLSKDGHQTAGTVTFKVMP
ncbi:copper homeostasis periplasmic binding protein CopC [Oryzifoliimicrobium ureilyticus]|uniref:copper homeostasis periplasmic binding protein CopC n=1 Tax=Oryzifoliimicrobium ureilyticus TaxID=3113724 RepID=UPI0030760579